jgi:hypothetical protein
MEVVGKTMLGPTLPRNISASPPLTMILSQIAELQRQRSDALPAALPKK